MIAIVDYGSGNVGAIADIFKQLKLDHKITCDPIELRAATRYILPGVGAFDTTMHTLKNSGLITVLNEEILVHKKKILGVCVGMQVLGSRSDEGILPGLGWIPGHIRKINENRLLIAPKLPHMGWNSIRPQTASPLFANVDFDHGFYFLHSYYFDATNTADVLATVRYGDELPCAVARGNIFGMQFHPEKSHSNGMAVFRNFASL